MKLAVRSARPDSTGGKGPAIAIRYTFALAMVALAMLVRHWLVTTFGPLPTFVMFYPAVLLVASIAGGGPGIMATLLSVLAAAYWYFPPFRSFAISSPNDAIALGIFGGASLFLCLLAERLRRARWAEAVSVTQEQELALQDMGNLLALDLDRRIVRWSAGCCSLYGFNAQEAQGQLVDELLRTQSPQPLEQIQRHLLEHGHWQGELTRCSKDGTELSLVILLALRRDEQGKPSAILEVSTDITSQKKAEAALRGSEARLQTAYYDLEVVNVELQAQSEELQAQNEELAQLMEECKQTEEALAKSQERLQLALISSGMATFEWDIIANKRIWDDKVYGLLGTDPESFTGKAEELFRVIHPEDRSIVQATLSRSVEITGAYDTEYRVVWPDGTIRHIAARGKVFRDSAGRAERMTGVCWDITERKKAEEALRNSERLYRAIGESIDYGVWVCDPDGRNTYASESFLKLVGLTQEQCSNFGWGEVLHPDDAERTISAWKECVRAGGSWDIEHRFRSVDGEWHPILARGVPVRNEQGEVVSWAGINLDISRMKRAEEMLKKLNEELENRVEERTAELREKDQILLLQSRQAAMGEMIGNIAHQWRQPLNALGLTVQQLSLIYDVGEFTREFLDKSVQQSVELIKHMSRTIDDFRNYFRPDKEKVEFKISEAIAGTVSLIEDSFKNQHISIEVVAKDDPSIFGYRNEFAQVLLNILNNARDALIEREIKEPRVTITICSEGGRAILTIADNAGGILEEIMGKIFDPYFTTKGPHVGTGIGLFMSKSIIEKNMGGSLAARNIADGAEFRIEVLNGIHI